MHAPSEQSATQTSDYQRNRMIVPDVRHHLQLASIGMQREEQQLGAELVLTHHTTSHVHDDRGVLGLNREQAD